MNEAVRTVDVHGMRTAAARAAVLFALKTRGGAYRIRVVHGYHSGTAIRDMVRTEFAGDPRVMRLCAVDEGVTELVLREL